jgi:phosphatidylserine/phosphatidylglycerophosphate/cardiolipin synthase-like enzyme
VTIHSHNPSGTEALYVHAKVAIVDDRWLTVGSANLNEHSLFNDTEINIATCDPMLARPPDWRCGLNTSTARSRRSTTTRPQSSMACGGRSPKNRCTGAATVSR